MPKPKDQKPGPPNQPKKPGDAEIDVDDAQIEPPKDDAFEKKEPNDDDRANRLKDREKLGNN